MHWMITGGLGFIGYNLIRYIHLHSPKDTISVCDTNVKSGNIFEARKLANIFFYDVRDSEHLKTITKGVDILVHLAAQTGVAPSILNPLRDCDINVLGTLNCLEAAKNNNCKMFIFASSGAVLGEQVPPIKESCIPNPISPYGASKLSGETYCKIYNCLFGIKTVSLRFSNVYGPHSSEKNSVIPKFIKLSMGGKSHKIFGDGEQTRDFIYVDDLCEGIINIVKKQHESGLFHLASGKETSVNKISNLIARRFNSNVGVEHTNPLKGDVKRSCSDISKIRTIGWLPKTNIEEGIEKTIKWFIKSNFNEEFKL